MDMRELDMRAIAATKRIVERVKPAQLGGPTPCAGWTLRDLLVHMVGNNNGFADAARGRPGDADVWDGAGVGDEPQLEFAASAARVAEAFRSVEPLAGTFAILGYGDVPAARAVGMHLIDYLTHGWDVAVSIGEDPALDEESCRAVLEIGAGWPLDSPRIWGPGTAFGYRVEVPADAPVADRMLGFLGRDPAWRP
ncbi:MAG TPA: TIGR03086 family metal-binding protein [Actinophytocola sp.]|jgi:uncharacterized protein (TIGR03086 family)|nr:TIGR03086 family metal-binding protein [Actinophytocola sp.]